MCCCRGRRWGGFLCGVLEAVEGCSLLSSFSRSLAHSLTHSLQLFCAKTKRCRCAVCGVNKSRYAATRRAVKGGSTAWRWRTRCCVRSVSLACTLFRMYAVQKFETMRPRSHLAGPWLYLCAYAYSEFSSCLRLYVFFCCWYVSIEMSQL